MNTLNKTTDLTAIAADADVVSYVAGSLSGDRLAAFERRLADDAELRKAVGDERQFRSRLLAVPGHATSADDTAMHRFLADVEADARRTPARAPWLARAASLLAVAVAGGVWWFSPTATDEYVVLSDSPATALQVVIATAADPRTSLPDGLGDAGVVSVREQAPGVWQLVFDRAPDPLLLERLRTDGFVVRTDPETDP